MRFFGVNDFGRNFTNSKPLHFPCPLCGGDVYLRFLKIGETAECKSCRRLSQVPVDAVEVECVPGDYPKPRRCEHCGEPNGEAICAMCGRPRETDWRRSES